MMASFTLTPEQEKIFDSGGYPIAICRPNGLLCGFVSTRNLLTPEEIAAAERGLDDRNTRWHTTKEVLAALRGQGNR